jgi:hypothetical protein
MGLGFRSSHGYLPVDASSLAVRHSQPSDGLEVALSWRTMTITVGPG